MSRSTGTGNQWSVPPSPPAIPESTDGLILSAVISRKAVKQYLMPVVSRMGWGQQLKLNDCGSLPDDGQPGTNPLGVVTRRCRSYELLTLPANIADLVPETASMIRTPRTWAPASLVLTKRSAISSGV